MQDNGALTPGLVSQIFKHYCPLGYMTYDDFVVFYISEVDKTSERSIRYWFRCLDLDLDERINANDLTPFLRQQVVRMPLVSSSEVAIKDLLCQLYVFVLFVA